MAFPVADLIQTFEPEVWEDFTEEWAHSQEKKYKKVIRYTFAGNEQIFIIDNTDPPEQFLEKATVHRQFSYSPLRSVPLPAEKYLIGSAP